MLKFGQFTTAQQEDRWKDATEPINFISHSTSHLAEQVQSSPGFARNSPVHGQEPSENVNVVSQSESLVV